LNNTTYIYNCIRSDSRSLAVLIDPEKCTKKDNLKELLDKASFAAIDLVFVGGSTVTRSQFEQCVSWIKELCTLPVVIFPGASHQISREADAILYLSLLSGRNPDFLIGHHVQSANELFEMDIEIIPTAYLLIDGGTVSSVAYVSQTTPIPRDNISIVKSTAMAARMQGKQLIYLDAGSGARFRVPDEMVREIKQVGLPVIIGGGVRDVETIRSLHDSGANVVVIGNRLEEDTDLLLDIKSYVFEVKD
jgi:phosphoglycerol geranylgeranyltransferase